MKQGLTDYRRYRLSFRERIGYGVCVLAGSVLGGWLLFNRVWLGLLIGCFLLPLFYKKCKEALCRKRKRRLEEEFCRYMQLAAASLASGTVLDRVFREVADSASSEQTGQCLMEREFRVIDRLIGLHYEAAAAFSKFAARTGSRDIQSMAEALISIQSTGGDAAELIKGGVQALRLKQDTQRDIRRTLSLPKMNHKILTAMPFIFLLLFRTMSPAYIACLYEGAGLLVTGAVALLTGLAWLLGERVGAVTV